jgi:outer membrane protein assembly factor BamB
MIDPRGARSQRASPRRRLRAASEHGRGSPSPPGTRDDGVVRRGLLLLAVLLATGCAGEQRPGAPLVRLETGENLGAMATAAGDVWVNDFGSEQLLRIDGTGGRVVARLSLGRRIAVAADEGYVWALRWGGRFFRTPSGPLFRVDPATNRVTRRIPLGGEVVFGVLAGSGDVWVWGPRRVARLDPHSAAFLNVFAFGGGFGELTGAVLDDEGLLVTTANGRLIQLGDDGSRRWRTVPALARAELLAVDRGVALASAAGKLIAVDARTGRLRWERELGFRISTLLPREGVLLIQGAAFGDAGDRLWALDARTGHALAATTVPSFGTTSMVEAGGALWFATSAGEVIVIPPLIVRLFLARAGAART